jgi:hypothetical protein
MKSMHMQIVKIEDSARRLEVRETGKFLESRRESR